jgi:Ca2+-binding EF-hand superfamily protein
MEWQPQPKHRLVTPPSPEVKLSDEHERVLRKAFDMFDMDNDGKITVKEFKEVMRAVGASLNPDEVSATHKKVDTDGNGVVTYDEFRTMMVARTKQV